MASGDWTLLTDGLDGATVKRGVSAGIVKPNGGGTFAYGFNSMAVTPGAVGLFANQVNFAPMALGGSIRGAINRGISGGPLNFSPLLFMSLQGASVNDNGYLLGLQDDDPHHIVLRKGSLIGGIPSGSPGALGILAKGTVAYDPATWLHLRLDVIANDNGDVILKCYQNDLDANTVSAPVWAAIPGIATFIDDALAINTGSAPYVGGRAGFAFATQDVTRRSYFDHLQIDRQT